MKKESYLKMRPLHRYDFCLTVVNPTAEQIEWGLTDENYEIRGQWAKRMDFTPTPEQIERGLIDIDCYVRSLWGERLDFTPTPEQIERGLQDEWCSSMIFLYRTDFTPTPEQIERALNSNCVLNREAMAKRKDFTPTPEQIERGLKDGECEVRECFEKNLTRWQKDILTTQFKPQKFKRQAL